MYNKNNIYLLTKESSLVEKMDIPDNHNNDNGNDNDDDYDVYGDLSVMNHWKTMNLTNLMSWNSNLMNYFFSKAFYIISIYNYF